MIEESVLSGIVVSQYRLILVFWLINHACISSMSTDLDYISD